MIVLELFLPIAYEKTGILKYVSPDFLYIAFYKKLR